jgi:S1-C subfamily serine protease
MKLPPDTSGALVNRVRDASPAQRGGVRRGDVVTRLEGQPVISARGFFEHLETATAGQELELSIRREEGPERVIAVHAEEIPDAVVARLVEELTGLALEPSASGGFRVLSVRPGSGAHRIGLQRGDLLLGINGRALEDEKALRRAVLRLRGQPRALIVVQRGAGRYHVTLPLA